MKTTALFLFALTAGAQDNFHVPLLGCPMAHCDPAMSDRVRMRGPSAITAAWFDADTASPDTGLGCSSNGVTAVCSIGPSPDGRERPHLKAYDADGKVLWTSGSALTSYAWISAPIINRRGEVIAADDTALVRFAPDGRVLWSTPTPGGRPISPTITQNGTIVLATLGGPISSYDARSGKHLATLDLRETLDGLAGRFETMNTPGASGNRVYVSTEFKLEDGSADPNHHARLYAIDADQLTVAWYYEFGARSGASPLVIGDLVIFDGDRAQPDSVSAPRFFAIRDTGAAPSPVWQYELDGPSAASAAQDPRGGLWIFSLGSSSLVRLAENDGAVLQRLDVPVITGISSARPWSAIGMAFGPEGHPMLIVSARTPTAPYVIAIDVTTETLLWAHRISDDSFADLPRGQWPILAAPDGKRVIVFTTRNGVRAVVGGGL